MSIFFCIIMTPFIIVKDALSDLHWSLTVLIQAILLSAIVFYFLRYVCALCRAASKNITRGWSQLIFVNVIFFITVILSSVFPVRLKGFDDPAFITFIFVHSHAITSSLLDCQMDTYSALSRISWICVISGFTYMLSKLGKRLGWKKNFLNYKIHIANNYNTKLWIIQFTT